MTDVSQSWKKIAFSFSKVEQIKEQNFFQKGKPTFFQDALQAAIPVLLAGLNPGWMQKTNLCRALKASIPQSQAAPSLGRSARRRVMLWLVLGKWFLLQTLLGSMERLPRAQLSAVKHVNYFLTCVWASRWMFCSDLPSNMEGNPSSPHPHGLNLQNLLHHNFAAFSPCTCLYFYKCKSRSFRDSWLESLIDPPHMAQWGDPKVTSNVNPQL